MASKNLVGENILIIKQSDLCLVDVEIIRSVMREEVIYDKLVIENSVVEEIVYYGSEQEHFWKKLGKSIKKLEIKNVVLSEALGYFYNRLHLYFFHLEETIIQCDVALILKFVSPKLLEQNTELQTIELLCSNGQETKVIIDGLIRIVRDCKTLKQLTCTCWMLLDEQAINETFGKIYQDYQIVFKCKPLPNRKDFTNIMWIVTKIQIELNKNSDNQEVVVIRPLEIMEKLINGQNDCELNCAIDHQVFKMESVTKFTFQPLRKCQIYYKSCFESFPNVTDIPSPIICDAMNFSLLSGHWNNLRECNIKVMENVSWTKFLNMQKLGVHFKTTSNENFNKFTECCPNITHLTVQVNEGIMTDACIKHISNNMKKMEIFRLKCPKSKMTAFGLQMIGNNLNELQELQIDCTENFSMRAELFSKLPKLQLIFRDNWKLCPQRLTRNMVEHLEAASKVSSVTEENSDNSDLNIPAIYHLSPEMLEKFFLYLNRYEQMRCRFVCKQWFDILSSNRNFERELNFRHCYISLNGRPGSIFTRTDFKYNRILVDEHTYLAEDEDLTELWERIGKNIEEIFIGNKSLSFLNALNTSWTASNFPNMTKYFFENLNDLTMLTYKKDATELLHNIQTLTIKNIFSQKGLNQTNEINFEIPNVELLRLSELVDVKSLQILVNHYLRFPKLKNLEIYYVPGLRDYWLEKLFETNINFNQLTQLLVVGLENWQNKDFELIFKHCRNLRSLKIGLRNAEPDSNFEPDSDIEPDDRFKEEINFSSALRCISGLNLDRIVPMMFEKLPLLTYIRFIFCDFNYFNYDYHMEPYKTYTKKGDSFIESCVSDKISRDTYLA